MATDLQKTEWEFALLIGTPLAFDTEEAAVEFVEHCIAKDLVDPNLPPVSLLIRKYVRETPGGACWTRWGKRLLVRVSRTQIEAYFPTY